MRQHPLVRILPLPCLSSPFELCIIRRDFSETNISTLVPVYAFLSAPFTVCRCNNDVLISCSICFSPLLISSISFLLNILPCGSLPISLCEVMFLTFYPSHYRTVFAFSAFSVPASIWLHLRSAYLLLHRRSTGLPCFLYMTNEWVRIRLTLPL